MNSLVDFLRPSQKKLFKRLCKKFKGKTLISKGNFILVHGQAPVMLVAHLDTVHEQPVKDICVSADGNIIMSPQGIGGDDRCGVFALVKIHQLSKIKPWLLFIHQLSKIKPWLLFTCEEEVGGLGAKKFCFAHQQHQLPNDLDNLKFLIELDRKGKNDAVFYNCDNPDFEKYIAGKGFKTAQGSFSDISVIAPELRVAAVNLSSGYYSPHTLHEYINRSELDDTICKVVDIISDVSHLPRFEYVECIQSVEQRKLGSRDESVILPRRVSASLRDIYKILLDFYSVNELESFRAEYGDQILWQIYNDEMDYFYHC